MDTTLFAIGLIASAVAALAGAYTPPDSALLAPPLFVALGAFLGAGAS